MAAKTDTRVVEISEIGIFENGVVWIRVKSEDFSYIYRAGREVDWKRAQEMLICPSDAHRAELVPPLTWLQTILEAVKSEYRIDLHFSNETVWQPSALQLKSALSQ